MIGSLKYKGYIAEGIAKDWLEKRGFKIIERNLKIEKLGEIDIIAKKEGVYYFIEVKAGFSENEFFPPELHFTKSKHFKIVKMANFIANKRNYKKWCIALLTITRNGKNVKIRFYKNVAP